MPLLPTPKDVQEKVRIVRVAPTINFPATTIQVGGEQVVATLRPPKRYPSDVRANQVLRIAQSGRYADLTYDEATAALQEVSEEDRIPPEYHRLLSDFVAAVDEAIPFDVQEIIHRDGVLAVARTVNVFNEQSIQARLAGRIEWTADELTLLKIAYPELDLEAVLLRHSYFRALRKLGRWKDVKKMPDKLVKFGAGKHWPVMNEDGSAKEEVF